MSQYEVKPDSVHGTPKTGPPVTVPPFELDVNAAAVDSPEGLKLETMLAMLEDTKHDADEGVKRLKDLKDDIKAAVTGMLPGRERIILKSRYLSAPWIVRHQESWVIDSTMLKAMEPFTWAKFAKKSQAWYLEAVKGKKP